MTGLNRSNRKLKSLMTSVLIPWLSLFALLAFSASHDLEDRGPVPETGDPTASMNTDSPEQTCKVLSLVYAGINPSHGNTYQDLRTSFRVEKNTCVLNLTFVVNEHTFLANVIHQATARGETLTQREALERIRSTQELQDRKVANDVLETLVNTPSMPYLAYEVSVADNRLFPGYTVRSDVKRSMEEPVVP